MTVAESTADESGVPARRVRPSAARDVPWWVYLVGLLLLTAWGAAIRAAWLDHPMRYDESWGFLEYILPRRLSAALVYSAPNNHVLHTLAVALAARVGGDGPAVLRMPAFLAGVLLIPAAAHLATVLARRRLAGLVAAAMVACCGVLIEYSVNARGYGMLCLAAVLLVERTVRLCRDPRPLSPWFTGALLAALGAFVIPIMVYPAVALAAVVVLQAFLRPPEGLTRRRVCRRMLTTLAAAGVLTVALYAPVIRTTGRALARANPQAAYSPAAVYGGGLYALVGNEFVAPRTLAASAAALPTAAAEAMVLFAHRTSPLWRVLVVVGLIAAVVVGVRRRRAMWLLPVVLPAVVAVVTLVQRVVPFARLWLFALPLGLAVASAGLVALAGWTGRRRWRGVVAGALVLAVAAAAAHSAWRVSQAELLAAGEPCLPEARQIVTDALTQADGHTGLAWDFRMRDWPVLDYYVVTLSTPSRQFVPFLQPECRRVLLVVLAEQSLAEVLENLPLLAATYGDVRPWRRYASATVYLARRRPSPASLPVR